VDVLAGECRCDVGGGDAGAVLTDHVDHPAHQ
jgi:hypothetical protein